MLNISKHKATMVQILKEIYQNVAIAPELVFKGGTAALLFYDLPRFSTDLDFDLLNSAKKELVLQEIGKFLGKYGTVKEMQIKRYTIFFLLSYGEKDHNIKIEISYRNKANDFSILNYLGISMKVVTKPDMFACKLVALTDRKETAMRDLFDAHYFCSALWDLNEKIVEEKTGKNIVEYLDYAVSFVEALDNKYILQGLGEILTAKQKDWVKNNLKKDLIFQLKLYREGLKKS